METIGYRTIAEIKKEIKIKKSDAETYLQAGDDTGDFLIEYADFLSRVLKASRSIKVVEKIMQKALDADKESAERVGACWLWKIGYKD